jgi:hypothetical protein
VWVRRFAHILSEILRLAHHDLALCRVVRVLVTMHMAVELTTEVGDGSDRFGGDLRSLSLVAFSVARPFLTVVLESLVFLLEDRVSALQFSHGHGSG